MGVVPGLADFCKMRSVSSPHPQTEPLQGSELGVAWVKSRGSGEGDAVLSSDEHRLGQAAFKNCPFLASGCRLLTLFFPK